MCATAHVWRTEGNFQELVFSFYHTVIREWTQVVRLRVQYLYPLGHLTCLLYPYFKYLPEELETIFNC